MLAWGVILLILLEAAAIVYLLFQVRSARKRAEAAEHLAAAEQRRCKAAEGWSALQSRDALTKVDAIAFKQVCEARSEAARERDEVTAYLKAVLVSTGAITVSQKMLRDVATKREIVVSREDGITMFYLRKAGVPDDTKKVLR